MTAFRISIPEHNLSLYDFVDLRRAEEVINAGMAEATRGRRWSEEHTHAVTYVGEGAPPGVVTLLAAMAQGHPLAPILDACAA